MSQPLIFSITMLQRMTVPLGDLPPKRMTRRPAKDGDTFTRLFDDNTNRYFAKVTRNGRKLWQTGEHVGFKAARTGKLLARAEIIDIRQDALGAISQTDVQLEGFPSRKDFFAYWGSLHKKAHLDMVVYAITFDEPNWLIDYQERTNLLWPIPF